MPIDTSALRKKVGKILLGIPGAMLVIGLNPPTLSQFSSHINAVTQLWGWWLFIIIGVPLPFALSLALHQGWRAERLAPLLTFGGIVGAVALIMFADPSMRASYTGALFGIFVLILEGAVLYSIRLAGSNLPFKKLLSAKVALPFMATIYWIGVIVLHLFHPYYADLEIAAVAFVMLAVPFTMMYFRTRRRAAQQTL